HLDEILQVGEIDVFFVGPSDLSQSMGHPGNPKAPAVAAAIDDCLARIRGAGRIPGMPASTEQLEDALAKGVRYIYTHVPKLLAASARSYFEKARG
ncbi:MAG: aldolase/citrate lyase family protein, partial [bacterium]